MARDKYVESTLVVLGREGGRYGGVRPATGEPEQEDVTADGKAWMKASGK